MASRYIISAAQCFFGTKKDENNTEIVTRILTAEDIELWIGDHNLFTSGETFIPVKRIRKIRRYHFYSILMSLLLVVWLRLPTILMEIIPITKWERSSLAQISIFQFWS